MLRINAWRSYKIGQHGIIVSAYMMTNSDQAKQTVNINIVVFEIGLAWVTRFFAIHDALTVFLWNAVGVSLNARR